MENGADWNSKDGDGLTPFHKACSQGHSFVAEIFVEDYCADVNVKDNSWNHIFASCVLRRACEEDHLDVVWFLVHKCPWLILERRDKS